MSTLEHDRADLAQLMAQLQRLAQQYPSREATCRELLSKLERQAALVGLGPLGLSTPPVSPQADAPPRPRR